MAAKLPFWWVPDRRSCPERLESKNNGSMPLSDELLDLTLLHKTDAPEKNHSADVATVSLGIGDHSATARLAMIRQVFP